MGIELLRRQLPGQEVGRGFQEASSRNQVRGRAQNRAGGDPRADFRTGGRRSAAAHHFRRAAALPALPFQLAGGDHRGHRQPQRPRLELCAGDLRPQRQPPRKAHRRAAGRHLRSAALRSLPGHRVEHRGGARAREEHPHLGPARAHGRVGGQADPRLRLQPALPHSHDLRAAGLPGRRQMERAADRVYQLQERRRVHRARGEAGGRRGS